MIAWDHVLPDREPSASERTSAVQARSALPLEAAVARIAGDDPRPLLVLRECLQCSGTEDALMSSTEDNERTYLLARWFHCVRLSPDVLEDDHPFRNLFPGEKPAHLFVANRDGSARHDLQGEHSRRELWGAMEGAIEANYLGSHGAALQKLGRILDQLDELDRSIAELDTRYELATAADGGRSAKVLKLRDELNEQRGRRNALVAEAVKVSTLQAKPVAPAPAAK
jgi:hypothetical protein